MRAEILFIVLTDHKNLVYLQMTQDKQSGNYSLYVWLYFNFTIIYLPGSRNVKPDALSRQFSTESDPVEPELILPFQFISKAWKAFCEALGASARLTSP